MTAQIRGISDRRQSMHRHRIVELFAIVVLCAGAGWLYGGAFNSSPWASVLHGLTIGMPILLFERGYVLSRWRVKLRKASTPTFFMLSVAVMVVAVAAGNAVAVSLLRYTQASGFNLEESPIPSRTTFIYSVAIATLLITAFRVRDLVGPKNLLSLIVGMHHKPVREVRVFLFLDLAGSTRFARQHGDVKALALLGRVFASLAGPVRKFGGEIDDYVGDMAVVTWRLKQGVDHAAVVRCLFEFLDEVEQDADQWRHDFGEVPRFRAALHCGSVLTAEIGLGRHKITYFGNVMNTTSRLESLAKELGIDVVVSTALLELLQPLPPGFRAEDLGVRMLRGHDEPLAVSALCRGAS